MMYVGYEFIRRQLRLSAFSLGCPAIIKPVTRIEVADREIMIPRSAAPETENLLDHLLFALKHEGVNLQVIAQSISRIDANQMLESIRKTPSSAYVRMACYLWESFTGKGLADIPSIGGTVANLFDNDAYITTVGEKNTKWRVNFNGLGSIRYCPIVRKTPAIEAGLNEDILSRVTEFVHALDMETAERALSWAYLSETESSFAIEREATTESKAKLFVNLLRQAHTNTDLTEEYLSALQSSTINNPLDRASGFRHEQNRLSGPLRGAAEDAGAPGIRAFVAGLIGASSSRLTCSTN